MKASAARSSVTSVDDTIDNVNNLIIDLLPNQLEPGSAEKISLKEVSFQIVFSWIAHCTVIQAGISMAYSTILSDGLGKDLQMSDDKISWIISLFTFSLPFGSLIVGPLIDSFGRKKICLVCLVPCAMSWIILMFTDSVTMIGLARIIAGFAGGLSTASLIYISEITHPQIRPMLLSFNSTFVSFGILTTYCLGLWFTWKKIAVIFFIFNCCLFFALLCIPESPYWVMCFGNTELSERKLKLEAIVRRLNKSNQIYNQELKRIEEIYNSHQLNKVSNSSLMEKLNFFYEQLKSPTVYKPTIILFILFLIQQLSGAYIIVFYASTVLKAIGGEFGKGLNQYNSTVILGMIRFGMSIITCLFSRNFGRRTLCMASCLGMAFSMLFLALFIYFAPLSAESENIKSISHNNWVALMFLFFYLCASCLGIVIIPWTLIGELFPTSMRGIMGGIMVSIAYWIMTGVLKNFIFILDKIGAEGIFLFFCGSSFFGAIFVYAFLPETLGKSFPEIEKIFCNNKSKVLSKRLSN